MLVPRAHEERGEGEQEKNRGALDRRGAPPELRRDAGSEREHEKAEDPDGREDSSVAVGPKVRGVIRIAGVEAGYHEERSGRREQTGQADVEEDQHCSGDHGDDCSQENPAFALRTDRVPERKRKLVRCGGHQCPGHDPTEPADHDFYI